MSDHSAIEWTDATSPPSPAALDPIEGRAGPRDA